MGSGRRAEPRASRWGFGSDNAGEGGGEGSAESLCDCGVGEDIRDGDLGLRGGAANAESANRTNTILCWFEIALQPGRARYCREASREPRRGRS